MGVVDAEGRIYGTRCGKAMFEWSRPMYRVGATRRRKRHVSAMCSFVVACWNVLGTCRGMGVEVRCGRGGRGRVYLCNQADDRSVRVVQMDLQDQSYSTHKAACVCDVYFCRGVLERVGDM